MIEGAGKWVSMMTMMFIIIRERERDGEDPFGTNLIVVSEVGTGITG